MKILTELRSSMEKKIKKGRREKLIRGFLNKNNEKKNVIEEYLDINLDFSWLFGFYVQISLKFHTSGLLNYGPRAPRLLILV